MLFDILFFVAAGLVVFAIYKFVFSKKAPQSVKKNDDAPERNQAAAPVQQVQAQDNRQGRNARDVRNRFVRNQNVNFNEDAEVEERKENEIPKKKDDNEEGEAVDLRKQQLKEAKKQEKQEQREAFKHALEAKEKKDAEKRNKYEEREKQREEEERKQEELLKQLEEDEKKRQEEEYAKWKDMFTVDEAGKETDKAASEENLIQKFVHYIKLRKVVMLDDLCAEFKLSTKDVIDRITKLLESKKLTGIIDDRGKFIYITDDEFKAVINFIQKRGRISRSDLVLECNRLIKMNPTEEDKEKLKKEESNLLQQLESDLKAIEEQTA